MSSSFTGSQSAVTSHRISWRAFKVVVIPGNAKQRRSWGSDKAGIGNDSPGSVLAANVRIT